MSITTGVTNGTPQRLTFGAGILFQGVTYSEDTAPTEQAIKSAILGATSDGITFTFTPEITAPELDGVHVDVKELQRKTGETLEIEASVAELTPDIVMHQVIGEKADSTDKQYDVIKSSALTAGHFYSGFGFYGELFDGRPFIILIKNAQCTSGLSLDNKSKETGAMKCTFKAFSDLEYGVDKLPYAIFIRKVDGWNTASVDEIDESKVVAVQEEAVSEE